jgi:hypothetical protein
MERLAYDFEEVEEPDELVNDRIPGMPLLGLLTGAVLSFAIWGAVAVIAFSV